MKAIAILSVLMIGGPWAAVGVEPAWQALPEGAVAASTLGATDGAEEGAAPASPEAPGTLARDYNILYPLITASAVLAVLFLIGLPMTRRE